MTVVQYYSQKQRQTEMDPEEEAKWLANIKGGKRSVRPLENLSEETLLSAIEYLRNEPQRAFKYIFIVRRGV